MKITSNENRILWTLRDLAVQHINTNDQGLMDSGYIRANRTAMEILVEYGHMELVSEDTTGGRWYQAKLVPAGETPNVFGQDVEGHDPQKSAEAATDAVINQLDHFFDETPLQRKMREGKNLPVPEKSK